ncbi:unnamed protein product [Ceratitis capitata]|uniref:(Mediterranean fruit fly) hypothetical protein n=1 Tax=Ceratitis capitata TaxID=7213 RepID=A0A811V423_CERCA|nr:unnamed protein product [Ceratitis capitata]
MPHILAAALEVRAVAAVAESMSCGNGATSKIEADISSLARECGTVDSSFAEGVRSTSLVTLYYIRE